MPDDPIPWQRLWYPRESTPPLESEAFLLDLDDELPGQGGDGGRRLEDLSDIPCLILVGPRGMGKTHAIQEEDERLRDQDDSSIVERIDLKSREANDLQRLLFNTDEFEAWKDEGTDLYLLLDNADAFRGGVDRLGVILLDELRSCPVDRLYLRIGCRTGAWEPALEDQLADLYGDEQVEAYTLAPLRREDVQTACDSRDVPFDDFISEGASLNILPLLARPVTLLFLLERFREHGELPDNQIELYGQGCSNLCDNIGHQFEPGDCVTTASERLSVASRLAALSMICDRGSIWTGNPPAVPPDHALRIRETIDDPLSDNGDSSVNERVVDETLSTGLFTDRSTDEMEWDHLSYAEYLAAIFLDRRGFTIPQIKELLFHGTGQNRRVVPQLRGIATWLAGIDEEVFRLVLETDPELLLSSDVSTRRAEDRRRLVDAILALCETGSVGPRDIPFADDMPSLNHAGLEDQLREYIEDQGRRILTRRTAIQVAEACETEGLEDDILSVLMDGGEDRYVRRAAGYFLVKQGTPDARQEMAELLELSEEEDPDDELKGLALEALWPDLLSTEELFQHLTPRRKDNFFGAYAGFLRRFAEDLTEDDLPQALDWILEQDLGTREYGPFPGAIRQILWLAWDHFDKEPVLDAVASIAFERIENHVSIFPGYSGDDDEDRWRTDTTQRRKLLRKLMDELEDPENAFHLHSTTPPLVLSDDMDWLVQLFGEEEDERVREICVRLILRCSDLSDATDVNRLLELHAAHSVAERVLDPLFAPIEIGSSKAEELRERHERTTSVQDRPADQEPTGPSPLERIEEILDEVEGGAPETWWRVPLLLCYTQDGQPRGGELDPDIRAQPGWENADEDQRRRILAPVAEYLQSGDPSTSDWMQTKTVHRPAIAGYKALHLLHQEQRDELANLPDDVWETWAPIIVAYPFPTGPEGVASHDTLLRNAYESAPGAVIQAAQQLIQCQGEEDAPRWYPEMLAAILDERMVNSLTGLLNEQEIEPRTAYKLIRLLLQTRREEAQTIAEDWLSAESPDEETDETLAVAAARALLTSGSSGAWDTIHAKMEDDPEFGEALLRTLAGPGNLEWGGGDIELDTQQKADLFTWIVERFPPDEDPELDSPGSVGFRFAVGRWRDQLPRELLEQRTSEAVDALSSLADEHPNLRYLRWFARQAELRVHGEDWDPPEPRAVLQLAQDPRVRLAETGAQLLGLVLDALATVQRRLQHAQIPATRDLWDRVEPGQEIFRPLLEEELSDWLKRQLEIELADRGIVLNREVEIQRRGETDIHIEAVIPGPTEDHYETSTVIIEAKGCWNQGLDTSMQSQLLETYMKNRGCHHGIYLVFWFDATEIWDSEDSKLTKTAGRSRDGVTELIEAQAENLSGPTWAIEPFLLDCSWEPEDQYDAGDDETDVTAVDGPLFATEHGECYHGPGCGMIATDNDALRSFPSEAAAESHDLRPCAHCFG